VVDVNAVDGIFAAAMIVLDWVSNKRN
jgi:hypothetical protein